MSLEKTLVLVKPDGVARGLVGEVIARIEAKGYTIAAMRMLQADRALLEKHYAEHQGKPFFEPLVEFMMSGPIVAIVAQEIASLRVLDHWQVLQIQQWQRLEQSVEILLAIKELRLCKILFTALIHPNLLHVK